MLVELLMDMFCCDDIVKFGWIVDIMDKEYYMNSFYYDVCKYLMFFDKLILEECFL